MKTSIFLSLACMLTMTMNAGTPRGVDINNLDTSVAPGEDFYKYACGGWMKANPLDPQYARFGTFDQLRENSREQVKDIVTNLGTGHKKGTIEQQVGDLYAMGMDSVRLNSEGFQAIAQDLARIKDAKRDDFVAIIANMHLGIATPFFDTQVAADLKHSTTNLLYLSQSGMGMGDRDYYLENDENTAKIRHAYNDYIIKSFELVGNKKKAAQKMAKHVMEIETALAQVAMSREERRDYSKQYNIMTIDELKSNYSNINWDMYFAGLGLNNVNKVCVSQLKSLACVNDLLATLSESAIKDYLSFRLIDAASSYMSDEFVQAHFDMYSKAMSGTQVMAPRWKRALEVPNSLLGEAVGQMYVAKYFPAESKKKMQKLVDNLKVALGERIANLTWMSDKTKVNALVKLNSFTVKIGYPDTWRDYSDIDIDMAKPYWTNVLAARRSNVRHDYSQLHKPVDKNRWWMTPQTVNAYYEPSSNEICFPAAILQPPYFDPNSDDACNYGAIGVVIGHEMTHGFDDQGRNFDQNGDMVEWWTEEDAARFKVLSSKLGAQYDAVIVADDVHANGTFTMGENIADHGGLQVSYAAFKKTEQGKNVETIDGFTPDQRFFLSYANVWAANITKAEILRRTKVDPHSLGVNRVNLAIRNLDQFFRAFDIKEGDKMYRAPQDRVLIW